MKARAIRTGKVVGAAILVSLGVGCLAGGPTDPGAPLGRELTLAQGGSAAFDGGRLVIGFDRVDYDSRCPGGDIVCIWEGGAGLTVEAHERSGPSSEYHLHTQASLGPHEAVHGAYRIGLVRVDTPPPHPGTHDSVVYHATFVVSRD